MRHPVLGLKSFLFQPRLYRLTLTPREQPESVTLYILCDLMSGIIIFQGELRIVISRTVSSDAEEEDDDGGGGDGDDAHAHSPKSHSSIKFASAESGLHLKMDSHK